MKTYLVNGGIATIDAGQYVLLTKSQLASRTHNVDVFKEEGDAFLVRAKERLQFKTGEVIGLESLPRHLASTLVEASGGRFG